MPPLSRLVSLLTAFALAAPALASVVAPSDPVVGEKVLVATAVCQGASPTSLTSVPVIEINPGNLHLRARIAMSGFAVASCVTIPILSPPVPAGTYDVLFSYVQVNSPGQPVVGPQNLGRVVVAPRSADTAARYRRLSGNWFDPTSPGTGVNLVQGASSALFAAWLTHPSFRYRETLGHDLVRGGWFVMPEGLWIAPNVFRGPLFVTRALSPDEAWDATKLSVTPAGIAKLTFTSDSEALFEVTLLHGVDSHLTQAQTLRRFRF